jgi:glutamyl-tRNA synthetase
MRRLTRLAPSPTGALHLGNARTFLVNWLLARQHGWRILLRIEDLDGPRVKRGADRQAIDDLTWLGIDWDDGPIYQSPRTGIYRSTALRLVDDGVAYPCICTRSEVASAASAPHADDGSAVYPNACVGRFPTIEAARNAAGGREPAIRYHVLPSQVAFDDAFAGQRSFDVASDLGDFVILKSDGTAAYQLAVVVDDAEAGVTDVVRGDDLIDSTPRQMLLYTSLGLADRIPRYTHLPLIVGTDGRRLAKRHGDTRLSYYRDRGVSPGRVRALLARWCGIDSSDDDVTPQQLLHQFDLSKLPRDRITFTPEDDRWLLKR